MDEKQAKALRAPFEGSQVGKLPKVSCKACSDNKRDKHCERHERKTCPRCKSYITTAHVDLDYVGHAAITDRLLQVDPSWSWEPVAFGDDGLPVIDRNGGLWIRLTVAGVTRLGYGDAEGKQGGSAVKEAIGDALRNASMRFGVALDLWHKGDLHADEEPASTPPVGRGEQPRNGAAQPPAQRSKTAEEPSVAPTPKTPAQARAQLATTCTENGWDLDIVAARFREIEGMDLGQCADRDLIVRFRASLFSVSDALLKAPTAAGVAR